MNPYLLLIGGFALWYIPTAIALLNMDFEIKGFNVRLIQVDYIDISVDLYLINETVIPFTVSSVDVSVYFNGTYITQLFVQNVKVPASGKGSTTALIRLHKEQIGTALWNVLINQNFNNSVLTFKGVAKSVGRTYPFTIDFAISDIGK